MASISTAWGLASIALSALLLAGCTGGAGKDAVLAGRPEFDATTGSVSGMVLDESELPVADVQVALLAAGAAEPWASAVTAEDGGFLFNFVAPGGYSLDAVALGYSRASQSVEVRAGQVEEVFVALTARAADVAYSFLDQQTRIVAQIMVKPTPDCMFINQPPLNPGQTKTCQGGVPGPGNAAGCGPGSCCVGYKDLLDNDTNWKTQIGEVMWRPNTGFSGKGFIFEILGPNVTGSSSCGGINQNDPRDFMILSDQPPIRNIVDDQRMAEREISPDDRCCEWRWRIFSAWCDLGNCNRFGPDVSTGATEQQVTIYYTIFWKEPMPEGYTAVPVE